MQIQEILSAIRRDFSNVHRFDRDVPHHSDLVRRSEQIQNETRTPLRAPEPVEALRRAFHPIPASPKNGGLYRMAYVHPPAVPEGVRLDPSLFAAPLTLRNWPQAINDPVVSARDLAGSLARKAVGVATDYRQTECHVISGERGVGKTAFLNYLFSTQHAVFSEHKVIWVRADLTLFGAREQDLVDVLRLQTFDILTSHYIDGGECPRRGDYFDDTDYAVADAEYRRRRTELSWDAFQQFLEENRADFRDHTPILECMAEAAGPNPSHGLTDREKLSRVDIYSRFVADMGYSFIYVLDGLDEASVPLQEARVLEHWRPSLFRIFEGKKVPLGLYIVCARGDSFREIAEHIDSSPIPRVLREWIVWPVPVSEVIRARVDLFVERLQRAGKKKSVAGWDPDCARLVTRWTEHAITEAFQPYEVPFDVLKSLSSSGHLRELLKFFRDALWETVGIIEEEHPINAATDLAREYEGNPEKAEGMKARIRQKSYRLWSVASLSYHNYFEQSIRYDAGLDRLRFPNRLADLPLIPVVWGDIEFSADERFFNNHLLTKIRVLEYLAALEKAGADDEARMFEQVRDGVSHVFGHDPDKVDVILRSMILQRLVNFEALQPVLQRYQHATLLLAELGHVMLEDWVDLPDYIESTMHLAAVPAGLASQMPRFFIQRKTGPLSGFPENDYLRPGPYVAQLLPMWAKFAAMVCAVEGWERTRVQAWQFQNREGERFAFTPGSWAERIRKRLQDKAERIATSAWNAGQADVMKCLEAVYEPRLSEPHATGGVHM